MRRHKHDTNPYICVTVRTYAYSYKEDRIASRFLHKMYTILRFLCVLGTYSAEYVYKTTHGAYCQDQVPTKMHSRSIGSSYGRS